MADPPKASVIIPLYNGEKYIKGALGSIFNQTYKDFEVIVVDDASTDNSYNVIKPYLEKIRYFRCQHNHGCPAPVKNIGIKLSKGKYIAFLDQDDLWLPKKLEKQIKLLESSSKLGLVYSDCLIFGNTKLNGKTIFQITKPKRGVAYKDLFLNYHKNFIPACTVMIRKNILFQIGYFDESLKSADDYDLWLRVAKNFRIDYINEILAKHRRHASNLSSDQKILFLDLIKIKEKFLKNNPDFKKELKKQDLKDWHLVYYGLISTLLRQNKISEAKKWIDISIKENGTSARICFYRSISVLPKFLRNILFKTIDLLFKLAKCLIIN